MTTQSTDAREASTESQVASDASVQNETQSEQKQKKGAQDRIRELIEREKTAQTEADQAKREAAELRAQIEAIKARPNPLEEAAKPSRGAFPNDDAYLEALADWKAQQAIATREKEQREAQMKAESEEIVRNWESRQNKAMKEIPDYQEVLEAADVPMSAHVHQGIVESEVGPHLAYYLALNPGELRRLNGMRPVVALRHMMKIEAALQEEEEPSSASAPKSRAPEPINPVKSGASTTTKATSFEEYRRRRQAQKKR